MEELPEMDDLVALYRKAIENNHPDLALDLKNAIVALSDVEAAMMKLESAENLAMAGVQSQNLL